MAKKNKRKHRGLNTVRLPWWRKAWARFTLIPLGALVAFGALAYSYKTTGANELRTQVYQPLFSDLVTVEEAIQAISAEKPPLVKALPELKRTGALELVPNHIRGRVVKVFEEASTIHSTVHAVRELALREISSRITQIRTEQVDRIWQQKAVSILRDMSSSKKGVADSVSFTMRHEGRSRAVDVRNPGRPVITGPGGPAFVVRDWLTYPASVSTIEELWTDLDYLYFNERIDAWYYQLTREDLKRLNTSLTEFLKPVYQILRLNSEFTALITARPALLSEIADIKVVLTDRVRDPKQFRDLVLH